MSECQETANKLAEANHLAVDFLSLQQFAMAARLRVLSGKCRLSY
jgi:hypothetical protein